MTLLASRESLSHPSCPWLCLTVHAARYSPDRQVLAFSRPAPTRAALRRQLRDSSIEARFSRPLTLGGRWKGKALQAWEHGLKTTLSLPQAPEIADEGEIELGRHNVVDDSTYQPLDEVPMPEEMPPVEFEEMPMPYVVRTDLYFLLSAFRITELRAW